jgi:hypothetical protein
MLVTWPLWWPAGGEDQYPSIPLLGWPSVQTPSIWLRALTAGSVVFLVAAALSRRSPSVWWGGVVVCFVLSFLLDQHRLQPWAYQTAVYAVVFACCDRERAQRLLIPLVASIYFFSALGKLDYQFVHTVGQNFLRQLWFPMQDWLPELDPTTATKLAFVFPLIEISAATGLLIRPSRRFAAWVIAGMHLSLIAMLGPWGADHSTGVLVWNAVLIGQVFLLLLRHHDPVSIETTDRPNPAGRIRLRTAMAMTVVGIAMLAPLGERLGYWDHWLSWSLYSPHTCRADIELHSSCLDRLPNSVRVHVLDDRDGDRWHRLSIEQWSLQNRRVPVYPQSRYQLALARWIARTGALDREIRVTYRGVSDRWTGAREEQRLLGKRNLWN